MFVSNAVDVVKPDGHIIVGHIPYNRALIPSLHIPRIFHMPHSTHSIPRICSALRRDGESVRRGSTVF